MLVGEVVEFGDECVGELFLAVGFVFRLHEAVEVAVVAFMEAEGDVEVQAVDGMGADLLGWCWGLNRGGRGGTLLQGLGLQFFDLMG